MKPTHISLHTGFNVGPVDPRIFGGFLEHLGRAVYEGVYDPECSHADANGLRTDVLGALRRLNMTTMRYPGGNFVSGYHWEDGVGPRDVRPTVRELAYSIRVHPTCSESVVDATRDAENWALYLPKR